MCNNDDDWQEIVKARLEGNAKEGPNGWLAGKAMAKVAH